jgi:hypothetical protein
VTSAATTVAWSIRGSYFESCNCDAICPCRRVDGVPGGRSTHGVCTGVLSWLVEEGSAGDTDLSGLAVALVFAYDDDDDGSPWRWMLYLDDRTTVEQREALESIFTGRLGGDAETHFPWAWKASELVAIRAVEIDVDHTPRRQRLRVRDRAVVRIRDRYPGEESVTCVIPGHEQHGEELITEELAVADAPFAFRCEATCGYTARFRYSG